VLADWLCKLVAIQNKAIAMKKKSVFLTAGIKWIFNVYKCCTFSLTPFFERIVGILKGSKNQYVFKVFVFASFSFQNRDVLLFSMLDWYWLFGYFWYIWKGSRLLIVRHSEEGSGRYLACVALLYGIKKEK